MNLGDLIISTPLQILGFSRTGLISNILSHLKDILYSSNWDPILTLKASYNISSIQFTKEINLPAIEGCMYWKLS